MEASKHAPIITKYIIGKQELKSLSRTSTYIRRARRSGEVRRVEVAAASTLTTTFIDRGHTGISHGSSSTSYLPVPSE